MDTLLITPGRAGSTHLTRVFEQHDSVVSTQEIFHEGWLAKMFGDSILEHDEVKSMHKDPAPFLDLIFSEVHSRLIKAGVAHLVTHVCAKIVGISPETTEKIIQDTSYRIIALVRQNMTEAVISGIIAAKTGKWSWDARQDDPGFKMPPMFIELDWIERNLIKMAKVIRALDTGTQSDPGRCLWLFYKDVFSQSVANACFNFQDLVPIRDIEISTVKLNPSKNYDLIFNRKEIDDKFGDYFGRLGSKEVPYFWNDLFSPSRKIVWANEI